MSVTYIRSSTALPYENMHRWIPCYEPAVKINSCDVDYQLLAARTNKLAIGVLVVIAASLLAMYTTVLPPIVAAVFLFSPLVVLPMAMIATYCDSLFSERVATHKAVREYLNNSQPSFSACYRIAHSLEAVKLLAERRGNLKKLSERGDSLLGNAWATKFDSLQTKNGQKNIFKFLVDNGAVFKPAAAGGDDEIAPFMNNAINYFKSYALEKKVITAQNTSPAQQCRLWAGIRSEHELEQLLHLGFNLEARNEQGFTPLMLIAQQGFISGSMPFEVVGALIHAGADITATVTIDGQLRNILDLVPTEDKQLWQFLLSPPQSAPTPPRGARV